MKIADLRDLVNFIEKTERVGLKFDTSRSKHPPSVWGYCYEGLNLIKNGKFEDAISAYRRAIELEPEFAEAHFGIGWALLKQGKLEDAVGSFEKSIKSEKHPPSYRFLGLALFELNKFDEAECAFRNALKLNPNSAKSSFFLGRALMHQKKYFEAEAAFKSAINLEPENAYFHCYMGLNLIKVSDELLSMKILDDAVKHFETAIRLSPDFAEAHFCLGTTLCALGKQDEANKHYQIAAGLGYKDAEKMLAELKVAK